MNKLDKLTSALSELDKIAHDLDVLSYYDNLIIGELPQVHISEERFLNLFDNFSFQPQGPSLNISTHLNNCCVFALVETATLGLKVKEVVYE